MPNTKTFKCAVSKEDSMSVSPSNLTFRGAFISISDGDEQRSIMLTKKQVKKLRKVLKKCLKAKGE
jgi:hypothetical protein